MSFYGADTNCTPESCIKEIDFVAIRRSEKLYIQVANTIDEPATFEREVSPLLKIADAYPKIIITRTRQEMYQYEGVKSWMLRIGC